MGNEAGRFFTDEAANRGRVEELVERFGFRIDLSEKVGNLSVGMKQRVEILKTLYRGADHHYSGRAHGRADAPGGG